MTPPLVFSATSELPLYPDRLRPREGRDLLEVAQLGSSRGRIGNQVSDAPG